MSVAGRIRKTEGFGWMKRGIFARLGALGRVTFVAAMAAWLAVSPVFAQNTATDDNTGAKVLLYDSGKWEYAPGEIAASGDQVSPGRREFGTKAELAPSKQPLQVIRTPILTVERLIMTTIVLLVGGTSLLFFFVIQPARKRRPLVEALQIIAHGQTEMYEKAEELLSLAITAGLRKKDIQEAYFARAYVRALRQIYEGAIADLREADRSDPAVAYLEIWTCLQKEEYKQAYATYVENKTGVLALEHGKRLVSLVCLNMGKQYWKDRKIENALERFEEVRSLGIHCDRVPSSAKEHQVTLGILALFDNEIDKAEAYFQAARESAEKDQSPMLQPDLGLLLCQWKRAGHPPADEDIGKLISRAEIELAGVPGQAAPEPVCKPQQGGEDQTADSESHRIVLTEQRLLLRNVRLCHAISLVHTWLSLPQKTELPRWERDRLEDRTKKVREIDSSMPEPMILLGLIDYYLFHDSMKGSALALLENARTKVPEIGLMIDREKKLRRMEKDRLRTFLALSKEYMGNPDIPIEMRRALQKALGQFARFRETEDGLKISEQVIEDGGLTIQGLQTRNALLRKRIGTIVRPLLTSVNSTEASSVNELMSAMEKASQTIQQHAASLEKSELELMIRSGGLIFREEVVRNRTEAHIPSVESSKEPPLGALLNGIDVGIGRPQKS
jgi:hypothetical protein